MAKGGGLQKGANCKPQKGDENKQKQTKQKQTNKVSKQTKQKRTKTNKTNKTNKQTDKQTNRQNKTNKTDDIRAGANPYSVRGGSLTRCVVFVCFCLFLFVFVALLGFTVRPLL